MTHRILVVAVLAACSRKPDEAPKAEPPPPTPKPAPAADAGVAPAPDASVAATPPPADDNVWIVADKQSVALAEEPGGTVEIALDDGKTDQLPDGTAVVETPKPADSKADGTYHVTAGNTHGVIDSHRTPADYRVSPDKTWAVVRFETQCGDVCFGAVWLVHGKKQRWKLFDSAVTTRAAWTTDEAAVDDTRDTVIVQLPSGMVKRKLEGYLSPAYAPDGTLYLRDMKFGVFTVHGDDKPKKVGKTKGVSEPAEPGTYDPGPEPVEFDASGKWKEPK
jgi:hypothetical protein